MHYADYVKGTLAGVLDLEEIRKRTGLGRTTLPNPGDEMDTGELQRRLPQVVETVRKRMSQDRSEFLKRVDPLLREHDGKLQRLLQGKKGMLERDFGDMPETLRRWHRERLDAEKRRIDETFDEYRRWLHPHMRTVDDPYVRIAAVCVGESR